MKDIVNKIKGKQNNKNVFDMSTKETRESRVTADYYLAKTKRAPQVTKWQRLDDYYCNKHYTRQQVEDLVAKNNWNFTPPVLPDPFIQVESQIDSVIPQVEFRGRDNDQDNVKAQERQAVCEYIVYNNKVKQLNTENERNLNKLGNAFWKVAFDGSIKGFGFVGDIVIGNPNPSYIFPDPAAYDIDDCEYIIYAYRQHRRKARRIYGSIIDECGSNQFIKETEIFDREENNMTMLDDTVQVLEYWYRDDEGDIACSIQVDFTEVKHIPKYWINTRNSGNQKYPFIKYCKIPVNQSFWDKGEIETIVDLVDAADREFLSALLTDMMQPADVIVYEPNSLMEGESIDNGPNSMIKVKDNKINSIRRLGGLGTNNNALNMIEFIHKKIEETTGNSVSANGLEPTKVTTASGIAQLNERADARKNIKKADRLSGFERLYELIDWTALEFYNTDRVIMIRGENDTQEGTFNDSFVFNSDNHKVIDKNKALALTQKGVDAGKSDEEIKQIVEQNAHYYPPVDVEIVAGDGINKSKAFTLQALDELIKTPVTSQNKDLVKAQIDLLDLPQKKDIKDSIDQYFDYQMNMPYLFRDLPRFQIAFNDLPPDAQLQVMQQMGIQSQGGLSNELSVEQQNNIARVTGQINPIPAEQQQSNQLNPQELEMLKKATPEQQQYILRELNISPMEWQQMQQGPQQPIQQQQQPIQQQPMQGGMQ